MKSVKYSIFSLSLIACLTFYGCEKFLDRHPLSELSPGSFFGDKKDMNTWITGCYTALQSTLSRAHIEWGDLRSDLYGWSGWNITQTYLNDLDAANSDFSWQNLYRVIARCNTAIDRFPEIPGATESDFNDYLGQCYGLRALMYFYAIRTWGDVPLEDRTWDGFLESARKPRAPVSDIKTLILSDLDESLKRLNASVTGTRKWYFNRAAAYALKTDVHIWFGEYEQALEASEWFFTGTNLNNFRLISNIDDFRTIFIDPTASTETIFSLYWNYAESSGCAWCQRLGAEDTNNPYKISKYLWNHFIQRLYSGQGDDGRFANYVDTVAVSNASGTVGNRPRINESSYPGAKVMSNKYSPRPVSTNPPTSGRWFTNQNNSDCVILFPIYRFADVYTLRASALNGVGRGTEALELVNDIRQRVGYKADARLEADNNNKKAVEWIILEERKLEFFAEGRRWFDLVRSGRDVLVEVMDPVLRDRQRERTVPETGWAHDGRMYAPVYYREFEANPALKQNQPYSGGE